MYTKASEPVRRVMLNNDLNNKSDLHRTPTYKLNASYFHLTCLTTIYIYSPSRIALIWN